ncbi:MAG: response regulator [Phycisphaeraceae bacterium]|nr:response regulator [Phycisphaeraceae bacterium]
MPETPKTTIVLIDDDPSQLRLIEHHLKSSDPMLRIDRVLSYTDAASAMAELPVNEPTVILCDYDMPNGSGLMWLPELLKADVGPVVMITATADEKTIATAFRAGASDFLIKSEVLSRPAELRRALVNALRRDKLNRRNKETARELQRVNQQHEIRNEQLREMTKTAYRFIDDVAHDFRTPLTVIQEFTSIIKDGLGGEVNEAQSEYLGQINSGARELNRIIDDFLDASKLRAEKLTVQRRYTLIEDLFVNTHSLVDQRLDGKRADIRFQPDPNLPAVFCDPNLINRAILNLVMHAVKESNNTGRIEVTASNPGNGDVTVTVSWDECPENNSNHHSFTNPARGVDDSVLSHINGLGLALNAVRSFIWSNFGEVVSSDASDTQCWVRLTLPTADPQHILQKYIRRVVDAAPDAGLAAFQITTVGGNNVTDPMVRAITKSCNSMDLLLPAADGKSLFVIGLSNRPDDWVERMNECWTMAYPDDSAINRLKISWLGSWPAQQLPESCFPLIERSLSNLRQSA